MGEGVPVPVLAKGDLIQCQTDPKQADLVTILVDSSDGRFGVIKADEVEPNLRCTLGKFDRLAFFFLFFRCRFCFLGRGFLFLGLRFFTGTFISGRTSGMAAWTFSLSILDSFLVLNEARKSTTYPYQTLSYYKSREWH